MSSEALIDVPTSPSVNGNGHHTRTDAELIRQCLGNDEEAWAALLDRYSGLIYSIALKCHLSPEDAADVFQSVCLIMLEDLGKLKDESKLSSWLTTVTRRQCHRVRQRQHRHLVDLDQVEEELANLPDDAPLPDEEFEQMEQERLVRQALSMMEDPSQRLLTYLFYEKESWSYEEIARELGLSVSTIGPKRGRCLKRLGGILNQLGF